MQWRWWACSNDNDEISNTIYYSTVQYEYFFERTIRDRELAELQYSYSAMTSIMFGSNATHVSSDTYYTHTDVELCAAITVSQSVSLMR